jgi:HAD superfamily hydrolase (TIGR01509 family)
VSSGATAPRRGLFLDLDGTLADTLATLRAAYHDFLERFGVAGSEQEFERLNGPPIPAIVAQLKEWHRLPGDVKALIAIYRGLVQERHAAGLPAPGAAELLQAARMRGWTVAVVTSAHRADAAAWLARTALAEPVAAIVGGDEVARPKPDPEPYRLALARTGCAAAQSLAIEDGVQGALAALGAGVPTWRIGADAGGLAGRPLFRGTLPDLHAALRLL